MLATGRGAQQRMRGAALTWADGCGVLDVLLVVRRRVHPLPMGSADGVGYKATMDAGPELGDHHEACRDPHRRQPDAASPRPSLASRLSWQGTPHGRSGTMGRVHLQLRFSYRALALHEVIGRPSIRAFGGTLPLAKRVTFGSVRR